MTPTSSQSSIQTKDLPEGLHLLHSLHMLINSARLYQDNSQLLVAAVQGFVDIIAQLAKEDDEISLLASSGRFYLQQEKIGHRSSLASMVNSMLDFFEKFLSLFLTIYC